MKKYIILLSIGVVTLSCSHNSTALLPEVSGKAGEVLVVADQRYWDNEPGAVLENILRTQQQGLPQEEPMFDVLQLPPGKVNKLFRSFRSIIFLKIGSEYEEPKIIVKQNVWAKTQLILQIQAKDQATCIEFMQKQEKTILGQLLLAERQRLKGVYKKNQDFDISKVLNKHGVSLVVPKGFKVGIDTSEMVFLLRESRDIVQGVFVYFDQDPDTANITAEYLIQERDNILKNYPTWEVDSSYMIVETKYDMPEIYNYTINKKLRITELRGLWKTKGGLLRGGPFVSITAYDTKRNRTVTADAFVFAPAHEYNKRNMIRELYAIICTLDFTE